MISDCGDFGLYVHWPFCTSKCPYCDFNSHVAAQVDQQRWCRALVDEVGRVARQAPGRVLRSVFFGGGTPSLMPPETVAAVIAAARREWHAANDLEITLEANPGSVDSGRFAAYGDAGVNRISIGVQALNDTDLRRLGRLHSTADALRAIETARRLFPRVSFDLIYARQGQGLEDWRRELRHALTLATDHLSLYQLTIEPGTAFAARHAAGGLCDLPGDDDSAVMYEATQEACAAAGLEAYEVSNHAADGAECRHNLIYWRGGEYAGVGPGAHGRLGQGAARVATEAHRQPDSWLQAVQDRGSGALPDTPLSPQAQAEEYLMMSLRLREGSDESRFASLGGRPLPEAAVEQLVEGGFLWRCAGRIGTTPRGTLVLNSVTARLLAD